MEPCFVPFDGTGYLRLKFTHRLARRCVCAEPGPPEPKPTHRRFGALRPNGQTAPAFFFLSVGYGKAGGGGGARLALAGGGLGSACCAGVEKRSREGEMPPYEGKVRRRLRLSVSRK
jgi:hypothetical protein